MIEVGMDQHKRFAAAAAFNPETGQVIERRLEHDDPDGIVAFLESFEEAVRVTLETTGNWYWLADLIEAAGASVRLCHTVEAKRRRRGKAKNDRLDALASEIRREETAIRATLEADDRAPILMSAPGIGPLTAYLMLHEIGPIERFPGFKQFASYCCVAPGTEESADWRGRPGVGRTEAVNLPRLAAGAGVEEEDEKHVLPVFAP